jgi:hypothetical protein
MALQGKADLGFEQTNFVIARFMRATQFSYWKRKMGCPDKPGNDNVK